MNNDFDYIKDIFDRDDIHAPDSLSEDNVLKMLEEADASDTDRISVSEHRSRGVGGSERFRRSKIRRVIALAACALIAVLGAPQAYNMIMGAPDTSLVNGELRTFENYGQIERLVDDIEKDDSPRFFRMGRGVQPNDIVYEETSDAAAEDSAVSPNGAVPKSAAPQSSGAEMSTGGTESHSDTYLQVEEVDEADIVKTDGKYIYYVNNKQEVVILSADKGKTKKVAVIGNAGVENYIENIFLKGDRLVTIGRIYDGDEGYTGIVVYNISDRSKPAVIGEFRQTGDIVSSRMVGDNVYLVTNEWVYKGGRIVPKCTINGKYTEMPAGDICCVPDPDQSSYVILSAVDITSGKTLKSRSRAVFGASNTIYCNDHRLYATVQSWNRKADGGRGAVSTCIMRAELDGTDVRWSGTATVRGYVDGQFSMDEKDGYFRIATTSTRNGMDVNNLFILDSKLKPAGEVTGFARNESIRSVRFIGDKAYVITYQAIDPLFVIDLSDPSSPRIEGEVKIDGFSTLLVPVSEDKLLGIGYATGDNGYGGEYAAGLKLALFDISDPSNPTVADSKEFKDMESPAQQTHLALTVNREEGWYAIPYFIPHYDDVTVVEDDVIIEDSDAEEPSEPVEADDEENEEEVQEQHEGGVLVFGAENKIKVKDQHKLTSEYLSRCVYIGDYIYALDYEGNVSSFKVK